MNHVNGTVYGRQEQTDPARGDIRPSSRRWPIIIVGMLLAHMAFIATAITLATRSKYEVIPDYYQKSLDWDKNRHRDTAAPSTNPAN